MYKNLVDLFYRLKVSTTMVNRKKPSKDTAVSLPREQQMSLEAVAARLHNTGVKLECPQFKGHYFREWAAKIQIVLQALGVWQVIVKEADDPELGSFAKGVLSTYVSFEVEVTLLPSSTGHGMWKALHARYGRTGQGEVFDLKAKLHQLKLRDGAKEAFIDAIVAAARGLGEAGHMPSQEDLCFVLLKGLPEEFSAFKDLQISRADLMGWDFDRVAAALKCSSVKVAASHPVKAFKAEIKSGSPPSPCRHCQGDHWSARCRNCWSCGKPGHVKGDCPNNNKTSSIYSPSASIDSSSDSESDSEESEESKGYAVDSAATDSMTNDPADIINPQPCHETVMTAGGMELEVCEKGTAIVGGVAIPEVRLVPELEEKLLSVPALTENKFKVTFEGRRCEISKAGKVVMSAERRPKGDNLYWVNEARSGKNARPGRAYAMSAKSVGLMDMHVKFGHLSKPILEKIAQVENIQISNTGDKLDCSTCSQGKITTATQEKAAQRPATFVGEIVSADLVGPIKTRSNGARYISVVMDHYSGFTDVTFLRRKTGEAVANHVKEFIIMLERQSEKKVRIFRSDGGREYIDQHLSTWLRRNGIVQEFTAPDHPSGNGKTERKNRTLVEMARTMLIDSGLPIKFWSYAVLAACDLQNQVLPSTLSNQSPRKTVLGRLAPDLEVHRFGCRCTVLDDDPSSKMHQKGLRARYLGRTKGAESFMLLLDNGRVINTRNVDFGNETVDHNHRLSTVDVDPFEEAEEDDDDADEDESEQIMQDDLVEELEEDDVIDDGDDKADERRTSSRSTRYSGSYAFFTRAKPTMKKDPDSPSPSEALSGPEASQWMASREEEMAAQLQKGTWDEIAESSVPAEANIITSRFHRKRKKDSSGKVIRWKTRLVARGFTQREGVDYEETYAPVCKPESLRMVMGWANQRDYLLHQMDVDTAFLNADLKETLYMRPPIEMPEFKGKVFKLKKAIYGLKQAGRAWYTTLSDTLKALGWEPCPHDRCLFKRRVGLAWEYIAVYVDDLLMCAVDESRIEAIKGEIKGKFACKDLGEVKFLLGIAVERSQGQIRLNQKAYITSLAEKHSVEVNRSKVPRKYKTPLPANVKLPKAAVSPTMELRSEYRELIGSLLHIARSTRPDISLAVGLLARHLDSPSFDHLKYAKRVVGYLLSTKDHVLVFCKSRSHEVVASSDADWAGDINDRKSTSGYVVEVFGAAVSWRSRKQDCVALSTMEAEYVAMSECCKEAIWVSSVASWIASEEIGTRVLVDNQAALHSVKEDADSSRSKHIDIRHHYMRDVSRKGVATFAYVPSELNKADMFTKPLGKELFHRGCQSIRVLSVSDPDGRSVKILPDPESLTRSVLPA